MVLLSKLEETLFVENQPFELSANRYPGVVHPQGFRFLKRFRLDPFPVFTYAIEGIEAAAGQKLIDELMAAATAPGLSYLHRWRQGDVVMWDNRATMHRGRPWPAREPRLMVRTTISATEVDGLASVRVPPRQAAE